MGTSTTQTKEHLNHSVFKRSIYLRFVYVGRAAMIGFFMAYLVDVLTGLDVVGQSGNFICKICLLATVIGVVLFRQTKSIQDLKNLADEATFYDKQWQASWQDPDLSGSSLGKK